MNREVFHKTISKGDPNNLCDALCLHTGLSKIKLKDAMAKGAVWVQCPGKKKQRIRRAKALVRPGDVVRLHYDPAILSTTVPKASCKLDRREFSVWYKPAGLLSQGSPFGDHCSLPHQIERYFSPKRRVYLVHRLDREVAGLILIAHTKKMAANLSEMLRKNRIEKRYHARVTGDLRCFKNKGEISIPLDGRTAVTTFAVVSYDKTTNTSTATIRIRTGRLHQIRRHFHLIGHPVIGDPRYGRNNSSPAGLQLTACSLSFDCPIKGDRVDLSIELDRNDAAA